MKSNFWRRPPALAAILVSAALASGWADAAPARPAASARADAGETRRLHAFFAEEWERSARDYPEYATYRGDHRFGDRLTDESPAARAARDAQTRRSLQRLQAFHRAALSPQDRVSYDIALYDLQQQVRFQAFKGYQTLVLGSSGGLHTDFADLLRVSPVGRRAEAEQMLARMAALPRRIDQEIERMREGMTLGWVAAQPVLARVLAQIDAQLSADVDKSPFFEPFTQLGSGITPEEQTRLRDQAKRDIADHVAPAMRRLRAFVADDYLPVAPPDGALSRYPGGTEVYDAVVEEETTTRLGARQIHDLGLRLVGRLRAEMESIRTEVGFEGDYPAFVRYLSTDPKFFYPNGEALLAGYRDIAKRIDPQLTKLFAELPRVPYGVRAMPAHLGVGRAEFYSGPTLDGTRPGWFNANLLAYKTRPIWGMETLVAHEAVPGHHLQVARAAELTSLPEFRREGGYTAYVEGWALYAETLGSELGLYTDPTSRYGHLQSVIFRACRLVVDTGLHAFGWTRQQAIDYMVERTGDDADFIATEVDRYTSSPGQALSYMVGMQKIVELRDRAKARLGERFDIRRFHQTVLDQGALPLDVLERLVDEWIAGEAAKGRERPAPRSLEAR